MHGEAVPMGVFRLPISEGIVDRRYNLVGLRLLHDALRRQPLLLGLGLGGYEEAVSHLLRRSGWNMFEVPLFFRVVHPTSFLHNIEYCRGDVLVRTMLDVLALTGVGPLVIKTVQTIHTTDRASDSEVTVEMVNKFEDWANELWTARRGEYGLCPFRDSETLRILYPRECGKFIRLKVMSGQQPIGWAVVLDTQLHDHKQFGNMRLGSLVNGFAAPADAAQVIRCATELLEKRSVDLIVSNQSHAAWGKGLLALGFMRGRSNFLFASSPQLTRVLDANGVGGDEMHFNRGDGDGPIHL